MLTHVVMFKFKENPIATAEEVARRLMSLPPQINEIQFYETGVDIVHSERSYDLVLISKFASMETMKAYQVHPAHLTVLEYIKSVSASILAVDYEES